MSAMREVAVKHPLALVLHKRPELTKELLGRLSEGRPLYIFSDGPGADSAVQEVREAAWELGFDEMVERPECIGLAASIEGAVDHVLDRHDTVIVLEDDCLPGPHFFDFMDECLDRYEKDKKIISVGGYTMALPESVLTAHPWDVYFFPRIETWGWATWRRAWKLYERDVADALRRASDKGVDLEQGGSDIPRYIQEKIAGKDIWSPGWLLASYLNGCQCAYPTESHIEYKGYDGKGLHCGGVKEMPKATQQRTKRYPDGVVVNEEITDFVRGTYG